MIAEDGAILYGMAPAQGGIKRFKNAPQRVKCSRGPVPAVMHQPCRGKHALDDAHCMDRISTAAHKHGQARQRMGKSGNEHPRRASERGKQQSV